jgi:alkylated DNA nucleotide flippase Atl1
LNRFNLTSPAILGSCSANCQEIFFRRLFSGALSGIPQAKVLDYQAEAKFFGVALKDRGIGWRLAFATECTLPLKNVIA